MLHCNVDQLAYWQASIQTKRTLLQNIAYSAVGNLEPPIKCWFKERSVRTHLAEQSPFTPCVIWDIDDNGQVSYEGMGPNQFLEEFRELLSVGGILALEEGHAMHIERPQITVGEDKGMSGMRCFD